MLQTPVLANFSDSAENIVEKPLEEEKPKVSNLSTKMASLEINN